MTDANHSTVPVATRLQYRWGNRSAVAYAGRVGDLRPLLPTFDRRPARYGGGHEVVTAGGGVVGRVSSTYAMVQHGQLVDALPDVLEAEGYDLDDLHAELTLSGRGERMELLVHLPALAATPADGYRLDCRLRLLNSVDTSTPLEAELQWYRQVCTNGMFGWGGDRLRRQHRFADTLPWVADRLGRRFDQLPGDRARFSDLLATPVRTSSLDDWADVFVARRWGRAEAARVLHVCRTGRDGVADPAAADDRDRPAHEIPVHGTLDVPGACAPVTNVYHVGQAMSWVAGQSESLNVRFTRTAQVSPLLGYLLN